MTDDRQAEPGELAFEHVGTMVCGDRLLICDVEYLPPRFAGVAQGKVSFAPEIEIEPGTWQVLLAYDPDAAADDDEPAPRFVLLTHDSELETATPLEHAQTVALLRVDSGRITALDVELRDDPDIQATVLAAAREQVPCMLRSLTDATPRGTLIDIDAAGVFELYAAPGHPRTALFLAITA